MKTRGDMTGLSSLSRLARCAKLSAARGALLLALAATAGAQTLERHTYTNLNKAIPDGTRSGLVEAHTFASEIQVLSEVRVKLNVVGQFNGDLCAYLRHVNAQATNFCVLLNRPGRSATNAAGYSHAGLDITLDSTALNDLHVYATFTNPPPGSPLLGTWQPDGRKADPLSVLDTAARTTSLDSFNGCSGSGEWTLFLADVDSGATNLLVGWELELAGAVAPSVTWPAPADIVYGTPLDEAQLNARAGSVAGTFAYSPQAGAFLNSGPNQALSVTFTPADTANYVPITTNVYLNVLKAPLTVAAANTNRLYGQPNPPFTGTITGIKNGDSIAATWSCSATLTSQAGRPYAIVPTPTGAALGNYAVTLKIGTLTISAAPASAVLASSHNPQLPGRPVTFTTTVSAVAPSVGTPSGAVLFRIDGVPAGSPIPLAGGVASCAIATLSPGTHVVAADYEGDGNFSGASCALAPAQLVDTPPLNLVITDLGNGWFRLSLRGLPNQLTMIQYTSSLQAPDWQTLTSDTSDDAGLFEYLDKPGTGTRSRFYRALYP